MKGIVAYLLAWVGVFIFASPVFAHVTVQPSTSTIGTWETYTMKVPVEKEQATTKIVLEIPEGVEFSSYEPIEGWGTTIEKNDAGKVATITWEASGEGILPGQFQRFSFMAANKNVEGEIIWDVYQYDEDGSVVEWTGDEGTDTPHAMTTMTNDIVTTSTATSHEQSGHQESQTGEKDENLEVVISVGAIVVIIVSFLVIGFFMRRMKVK